MFQNVDTKGEKIGKHDYGYRLYDDIDSEYCNYMDKEDLPQNPHDAIQLIADNHPNFYDIACERGFFFNGEYADPKDFMEQFNL